MIPVSDPTVSTCLAIARTAAERTLALLAEEPDVECLACMDSGMAKIAGTCWLVECPECRRGEWGNAHELADESRRGK